MSRIAEIENYVLEGKVLDEYGNWIPIADKKAAEETFVAHLAAGEILQEGRWISIAEAKSARTPSGRPAPAEHETEKTASPFEPPANGATASTSPDANASTISDVNAVPFAFPPETVTMTTDFSADVGTGEEYPPETKTIFIVPSNEANGAADTVDPISSYAVETGLYVVDRNDTMGGSSPNRSSGPETISSERSGDTKRMPVQRLSSPPSAPSWEKSKILRSKGLLLVVGIVGATLAGAAIVVLILLGLR